MKTVEKNHFRVSAQRRVILDFLRTTSKHLTAEQIFGELKVAWPSIGLGTVYRNLKFLHEHGYIEELVSADHVARYSRRVDAHAHFRCIQCGEISEYDLPKELQQEKKHIEDAGHYVRTSMFEFSGTCATCAKKVPAHPLPDIFCQAYMKELSEIQMDPRVCGPCTYRESCQYAHA